MSEVRTSYGSVRGAIEDGVHVFRGIPFAKPPVGERRWRAPEKPDPWSETRDASSFGPCAIQSTISGDVGELIGIATHGTSEDCLYLNVWTPAPGKERRPVMVWIHGGGNTVGAGSQPRVNGEHLARIGDVVVVTLNYRLGALGFLHAPELGATGNEALLDQALGLNWVVEEIEAFGGDPSNITVFGQSAGGFDIAQLMAMPSAANTFSKAVPMSGSLTRQTPIDAAHGQARELANAFGGFDSMRSADAADILAKQATLGRWGPVADGEVLPEDAAVTLEAGRYTKSMPLMIGHTRDESTLFTYFNPKNRAMDRDALMTHAHRTFKGDAERAVLTYESDRAAAGLDVSPFAILAAMSTDQMFRLPAIRTAEAHLAHTPDVWFYRFDFGSPAHDGALGSCHSLDIPFVWGTHGLPDMQRFCGTSPAVATLSTQLMNAYLAFAHHGDPNHEGIPTWVRYTPLDRTTMLFDEEVRPVDAPLDEIRKLYSEHLS